MTAPIDGRYRLLDHLGDGGTSTVYRAWDTVLERPVALKLLRTAGLDARDEAVSLARAGHPNVVALYDIAPRGKTPYLVMEYVDGQSLDAMLAERGHLPLPQAVDITRQVGAALEHAHGLGVLHCDLTPANVLVSRTGDVKLTDFTLARRRDGDAYTGPRGWSRQFAAPEQPDGDIGPWTDIHGLGTLLSVMVGPLSETEEGQRAAAAILRATAPAPGDRFGSIREMLDALPGPSHGTLIAPPLRPWDATRILLPRRRPAGRTRAPLLALCATLALALLAVSAHFTVFASAPTVTVPQLASGRLDSARLVAKSLALRPRVVLRFAPSPAGTVIRQAPRAGSAVARGATITLVVSRGPARIAIASVMGETAEEARATLTRLGFRVDVHTEETISQEAGVVLEQSPAAGERALPGSTVHLIVSEKPWWWVF